MNYLHKHVHIYGYMDITGYMYSLGDERLESSSMERDLEVLADD